MPGCFGLSEDHCHTRLPVSQLVESRGRVNVHALNKNGALTEGAVTELRWGENPYHLAAREADILINGTPIPLARNARGVRFFVCPACGRRRHHIYFPECACRTCLHLDYASRHLYRSVPGVHRVMRWRRQIGADPHPFAPIPKRQRHHKRYYRVVARILLEERALLGHLRTVTHDLERRARLRGMLPK